MGGGIIATGEAEPAKGSCKSASEGQVCASTQSPENQLYHASLADVVFTDEFVILKLLPTKNQDLVLWIQSYREVSHI